MESSESSEPHTHLRDWLEGLSRVRGKGGRPCGCWGTRQNKALCTQLRAPWIVWGKAFTPLDAHVRMTPAVPHKQPGTAQPPGLRSSMPSGWVQHPGSGPLPPGPSLRPRAGLGVPGSHQGGESDPAAPPGKVTEANACFPTCRREPAFLLPSSRRVPGELSSRPALRPDPLPSPPRQLPPGIPVHGHLLGPEGPADAGRRRADRPRTPLTPLEVHLVQRLLHAGRRARVGAAGPIRAGPRRRHVALRARPPAAGRGRRLRPAWARPQRTARSDHSASARATGPTNQASESGPEPIATAGRDLRRNRHAGPESGHERASQAKRRPGRAPETQHRLLGRAAGLVCGPLQVLLVPPGSPGSRLTRRTPKALPHPLFLTISDSG